MSAAVRFRRSWANAIVSEQLRITANVVDRPPSWHHRGAAWWSAPRSQFPPIIADDGTGVDLSPNRGRGGAADACGDAAELEHFSS
jgi:hypothetical protein